ncbi:MAG: TIGR04053 family radical SAM/SPASM domain-containing protein [Planctomycetota bacterium]|jgi:radical SAM protein
MDTPTPPTTSTPPPASRFADAELYRRDDFDHSPFVVFYETTQACDLVCQHCRACAQPDRHPEELDTETAMRMIEQLAEFPIPPMLVFTGGDPLKRKDVNRLIRHATQAGLVCSMTPSATPLVTPEALEGIQEAGITRLAVSLDGADAETHDAFRGVGGSYARTLNVIDDANAIGLPVQINTTVCKTNMHQIDTLATMLGEKRIVLWSVFFLVPVGRGMADQRITPEEYELVFERLWHHAQTQPYSVKTTEAQHYRRFVMRLKGDPRRNPVAQTEGRIQRAPLGVNDGKGVMFVSHIGEIYPSGFLPLHCGRFPNDSVVDVYQNHEVFKRLRDPDHYSGKCGVCEYRNVCGGSRSRTYALTGDPYASEPDCVYYPAKWDKDTPN